MNIKSDKSSKKPDPVLGTDKKTHSQGPLVSSPAAAKREIDGLRRGQEERDAAPADGENDARATLI
jgi:hypothetical protein